MHSTSYSSIYNTNKTRYLELKNIYRNNARMIGGLDGDNDDDKHDDEKHDDEKQQVNDLSRYSNEEINLTVTERNIRDEENVVDIQYENNVCTIKLIKDVSGKSGDNAYIVTDINTNTKYILKVFNNKNNEPTNMQEIKFQQSTINVFLDDKFDPNAIHSGCDAYNYNPCPNIYCWGHISRSPFNKKVKESNLLYVLMELFQGKSLHDFVSTHCPSKSGKNVITSVEEFDNNHIDMYNIIMQLFFLISKLHICRRVLHCDLHDGNIFIVKSDQNYTFGFDHIDIHKTYQTSGYLVKMLDFGKSINRDTSSVYGKVNCPEDRHSTLSLEKLKSACSNRGAFNETAAFFKVALGRLAVFSGNIDINFLATVIIVLQLAEFPVKLEIVQNINTQTLRNLAFHSKRLSGNALKLTGTPSADIHVRREINDKYKKILQNVYKHLDDPMRKIDLFVDAESKLDQLAMPEPLPGTVPSDLDEEGFEVLNDNPKLDDDSMPGDDPVPGDNTKLDDSMLEQQNNV